MCLLYFCAGQVLSEHICLNIKCQSCFWGKIWDEMSFSSPQRQCDTETPQGKVHSFASNRPSGCPRLPCLIMHQLHSAKWSSIYTNCQVIKGAINCRTLHFNQRQINPFAQLHSLQTMCSFRLKLFSANLPFPLSFSYLKEQMKRHTAKWYYLVVFSGLLHCYQVYLDRNRRLM